MDVIKIMASMKRFLLSLLLLNAVLIISAQSRLKTPLPQLPAFQPGTFQLWIPSFLPGVMDDSVNAFNFHDTLIYNLNGQIFPGGYLLPKNSRGQKLSTPWETIAELVDAYKKRDRQRIVDLYNYTSADKVAEFLNGADANSFLDYVSKSANASLKIMGGIDYGNGIVVFVKDSIHGVHLNYLVKEGPTYKLSTLEDDKAVLWNIMNYFNYVPKPPVAVKGIGLPDSLNINGAVDVRIRVPEAGDWVGIYLPTPGESIRLLVQDNGPHDLDPDKNVIEFSIPGVIFITPGTYTFYIASFNYPAQRVTKNYFLSDAKYKIKVYEKKDDYDSY